MEPNIGEVSACIYSKICKNKKIYLLYYIQIVNKNGVKKKCIYI